MYAFSMSGENAAMTPEKDAVVSILKAADRIRRYFHEVMEPWGVTQQQFNVLRILRGAGPEGLPTLEIGERMIEKTPGITRLLDRLEEKGWVRRERCREDRRQVFCYLTGEAHELLAELDEPIIEGDQACMAKLSRFEQRQLSDFLSRTLA
jgi:DNA-binding MarR family transcriptional regulator